VNKNNDAGKPEALCIATADAATADPSVSMQIHHRQHCIHTTQYNTELQKYYYFNTTNIFTLTFRSLSETFVRRSLFNSSSGSCHDSDATWQEIGCTCGSAKRQGKNVGCVEVIVFLQ